MSYHHTLEAAVVSLHEIEDLIKRFPENGKIPSIDIDLALQKLRNLYELLLMMKGNEIDTAAQEVLPPEPSAPKQDEAVFLVEESKKTTVTLTSSVEEVKTVKEEEKTETSRDKKSDTSDIKAISVKKSAIGVQTLADQFKGRATLLESLSSSFNHESETLAHSKPISDLMSAIALNDRFTFIRELFNNDKKAFETAIASLNDAGTYSNAYDYISQQFAWDMDDEAVQLFLSVLRRKYVKGRNE